MLRAISILLGTALLAACSVHKTDEAASPAPQATATAGGTAPASAAPAVEPSPVAEGRKVEVKNDLIDFTYAYPAQAAAIPNLKQWLDADLDKQKADIRKGAIDEREASKKSGFPAHQYSHTTDWKVVTEIPGWLSLSADRWEYTGGAHGNPWSDSLLWDKTADVQRKPLDLFVSKAALSAAIRGVFCDQIDKQREEKRDGPVNRKSGDEFDECIDPVDSTIILGSSDKTHFDRVGVLVGPYAAGPYVEGTYEAALPVTAKVLAAVKPEYRKDFAIKR